MKMREIIVNRAAEMFLTLGFKSVTMDDIAAELGISKKTIYQHFGNKEELVEAATMHLFVKLSSGIDDIRDRLLNPVEEMFTIRNYMMQSLHDESASPLYQLSKFFPKIMICLRTKQFEKMHTCMKQNLNRGIELGIYRDDLDIEFISRIYFTGLTGIKDTDIFPNNVFAPKVLTELYLEYHLRSIVTPKGLETLNRILAEDKIIFKK